MKYALLTLACLVLGLALWLVMRERQPSSQPGETGFCTMEAKLCPDGSSVGRVPPACEFAPCPESAVQPSPETTHPDIRVTAPVAEALVTSPLLISGVARGTWYFEASFPVSLLDGTGRELARGVAQAAGDWMTTDFVPFSATLTFAAPTTATGTLVLERDNPSGLPEHSATLRLPVRFR